MSHRGRAKNSRKQGQPGDRDARFSRLAEKKVLDHHFQDKKGPWEDDIETLDTPSGMSGMPDSGGPVPN